MCFMSQKKYSESAEFGKLVSAIKKKRCILFLGAGINRKPPEASGTSYTFDINDQLPDGKGLCERLISKSGLDFPEYVDKFNLQQVSQYIVLESKGNRFELNEMLLDILHSQQKPSPLLLALADLEFPLVITTNYDRLFEKAVLNRKFIEFQDASINYKKSNHKTYGKEGKTLLNVMVYSKDVKEETPKYVPISKESSNSIPTLFKMHGDLCLEGANGIDSAVITDEDYIDFIMRMTSTKNYPVPQGILQNFFEMPIIFIGYSLKDYNFRLLMKILHKDKNNYPGRYSIDPKPDELIKKIFVERFSTSFFIEDAWTVIPEIYHQALGKPMPNYYG